MTEAEEVTYEEAVASLLSVDAKLHAYGAGSNDLVISAGMAYQVLTGDEPIGEYLSGIFIGVALARRGYLESEGPDALDHPDLFARRISVIMGWEEAHPCAS